MNASAIIPPNAIDGLTFSPIEFGLWLAAAFFAGGLCALLMHWRSIL